VTIAKAVDSHAHVFCATGKYAFAIDAFTLERCVWGSDWPWVRMDERMDYGPVYACLQRWLPDENDRRKVLWESPARLFGFK
jgi:predicted TIM-barrel fold metal-dependent hydrolase